MIIGLATGVVIFRLSLSAHQAAPDANDILRNKVAQATEDNIDSDKSVFNDRSATPEDVFELKIGPNTEVTDLTSLKTSLKRFLNNF